MNEVYVPYEFEVEKGQTITKEYFTKGKKLYEKTIDFCEKNLLKSKYIVDTTAYAKGIRVQCKYKKDVKLIQQWIKQ